MLIKTPLWQKFKAMKPLPFIRHDVLTLVLPHFPLCIKTIAQKSYYVFVLHLYETANLMVEVLLVHIKFWGQSFHSNCATLKLSLQSQHIAV